MVLMGLAFVTGLAAASATVVAVTAVASLTLLPALLGFAGERIELTRWRGLIAALLVAVGLVGVALAFQPLALVGMSLAAVVLLAELRIQTASAGGPSPQAETVARDGRPTDGAASSSTARGSRRSAAHRSSSCCDAILQSAARLLRRGQLPGGDDHP